MTYPLALADREIGPAPDRNDYGSFEEYRAAWYFWRAVRRDASPTEAELDAWIEAVQWRLACCRPRTRMP